MTKTEELVRERVTAWAKEHRNCTPKDAELLIQEIVFSLDYYGLASHSPTTAQFPVSTSLTVLIKLGSIAVHVEELLSDNGHPYDRTAIESLLSDPEITEWIKEMDKMAFLPKKR